MAVYKCVLQGEYAGQAVNNILYYRNAPNTEISGLTLGGTQELCNLVIEFVWPKLKAIMSAKYTLRQVSAYVYQGALLALVYQNPYTVAVGEVGNSNAPVAGPMSCAIFKFGLEPTPLLADGPKPPKRGYLAIGPLMEAAIDDEGHITPEYLTASNSNYRLLADQLATNLVSILPPAIFYPVRVHNEKVLGVWSIVSFADINSCAIRGLSSIRKSRQLEF
jgi:hypothetical protein